MNAISASEWYSPTEALDLFEQYYSRVQAKSEIADRVRDGLIRAHADLVWDSRDKHIEQALDNREKRLSNAKASNPGRDLMLETAMWADSQYWSQDVEQWRWGEALFFVTLSMSPVDRTILEGVKLSKKDVDAFIASRAPKLGGKPKYVGWAHISLALLQLEREGQLNANVFKSGEDLGVRVLEIMAECDLPADQLIGDDSTRRVCSAVWQRLQKEGQATVPSEDA